MNILLWGQYPRSERLVQATRDFDRKRITQEELRNAQNEDSKTLMMLQEDFPYASTGLFGWQDLLRPFADIVPSLKVTGLKRFFETNTFWKVLEPVTHPPSSTPLFLPASSTDEGKLDVWIKRYFFSGDTYPADAPLVFTLPFIYLFKEYTRNVDYKTVIEILQTVLRALADLPNKMLVFAEPSLGWRPLTNEEKKLGLEFLEKIKSFFDNPVIINTYFFDIEKEKDFLYSLPVDGIGIDFYANSIENVLRDFPQNKMLLAGALASDSTRIEEKEKLAGFFNSLEKFVERSLIWGASAGPAELLPRVVADNKIRNLKEVLK